MQVNSKKISRSDNLLFVFFIFFVERLEQRLSSKPFCPKKEGALASNEFITKFKKKTEHNTQTPEDELGFQEQMEATNLSDNSDDESDEKPNGQM